MVGIEADRDDAGDELEVPMGMPLALRLPPAGTPWRAVSGPVHVQVDALEPGDDGTQVRATAVGPGTDLLRFENDGGDVFEVTVTVTEPLFNE